MSDLYFRERERARHENKNLKKVELNNKNIGVRMKLNLLKYGFDVS
jgi:hypothetical protein